MYALPISIIINALVIRIPLRMVLFFGGAYHMALFSKITALSQPFNDRLSAKIKVHYFRDALACKRLNPQMTPSQVQHAIFSHMPTWVNRLMGIRNRIVSMFGFDASNNNMTPQSDELCVGDEAGFLMVIEKHDDEIISYADDKHMTFYLSVAFVGDNFVISSLVNQKTTIGRIYMHCIAPFHYFIARIVINNAIKAGRV